MSYNSEIKSIHITNINHNYSLRQVFEEILFLKIGDIIQIVLCSHCLNNKKSEAYIYFKPANNEFVENIEKNNNSTNMTLLILNCMIRGYRVVAKFFLAQHFLKKIVTACNGSDCNRCP